MAPEVNGAVDGATGAASVGVGGGRRPRKVVIVAVGGPTCSGKTTLSKHLNAIIPGSIILHQDDFAPPSDQIPMHPVHDVQDWDDPRGALEWPRMRSCLQYIRTHGHLPDSHFSHDDLNIQPGVAIPPQLVDEWRARFASLSTSTHSATTAPTKGKRKASHDFDPSEPTPNTNTNPDTESDEDPKSDDILFVIADGFLLYWDEPCVAQYDVKLFVRESYSVLKHRREVRQTYHTADGLTWRDPPNYWDNIVWPAFLLSHRHAFLKGDVEEGEPDEGNWAGKGLVVLKPQEGTNGNGNGNGNGEGMARIVERACEEICRKVVKERQGTVVEPS